MPHVDIPVPYLAPEEDLGGQGRPSEVTDRRTVYHLGSVGVLGYGGAVASSGLVLAVTLFFAPVIGNSSFELFLLAVMVSTWYGGLGPGLLATGLGGLAIDYFFEDPPALFAVSSPRTVLQVLLFLVMAVLITYLVSVRQARLRAESARAKAEATVHLRAEVLASVSHDLKRPLTFILLSAQVLQEQAQELGTSEGQTLAAGLARIGGRTVRMLRLINELLDVARLQIGEPLALRRRTTDLVMLARQVAEEHQRLTTQHQIRVEATVAQLVGNWDAERLERVLDNLVDNAVKYSPNGGMIVIEVMVSGPGLAQVAVRDHGVGIPPQQLEQVFNRFHRAHGDRVSSGAGLGLYVSRQIVSLHGGQIEAAAPPDGGARFLVTLRTDLSDPTGWQEALDQRATPKGA